MSKLINLVMLVGGWFTRRLGGYLIVRCAMWFVFESAELFSLSREVLLFIVCVIWIVFRHAKAGKPNSFFSAFSLFPREKNMLHAETRRILGCVMCDVVCF